MIILFRQHSSFNVWFYAFIFSLLCLVSSNEAYAIEINIVDQSGDPVTNAFVAIPEGKIVSVSDTPAVMDQINIQFSPHVLAVAQGREVIFPNSDNIRHHVYSFSEAKRFEIKLYEGVPKSPISFDSAGLVALGCNIHDSMLAYIYVSPWPDFTVTGNDGRASLSQSSNTIAIWHPWLKGVKEAKIYELPTSDKDASITIKLDLNKPKPVKTFKNYRRRYND